MSACLNVYSSSRDSWTSYRNSAACRRASPARIGRLVGLGDRLEQRHRHVLADDRGGLQQALVLRREPIDARGQHRLDRGRDLERGDRLRQPIPAPRTIQRLRLHQGPDRLLQEKRIPALDEKLLEGSEAGVLPEERIQKLARPLGGQGIEP